MERKRKHVEETFALIDPTNGRTHAHAATAGEVERHAVVIAGCRGAVLVIKNTPVAPPEVIHLIAVVEDIRCRCAS